MKELIFLILLAMSPFGELRLSIPYGLSLSLPLPLVFSLSVLFNILVFFPLRYLLDLLYFSFFSKYVFFRNTIEKIRRKTKKYVDKYGALGLIIFVAIPLPTTGAWTATIASWIFGVDWRKSATAISIGVLIAGFIVTFITLGFLSFI